MIFSGKGSITVVPPVTQKNLLAIHFSPQDNQIKHTVVNSNSATLHFLPNRLDRINLKLRIKNQKL